MTDPKKELQVYLRKLIDWFVFIKYIFDEREKLDLWIQKPEGIIALDEGRSIFNLFQRISNQTLLIEICKFIDDDEEKSLIDFVIKCKEHAKPLEPMLLLTEGFPKKILSPEEFEIVIDEMLAKLDQHKEVIQKLKIRRNKALAHTDASFFNDPDKHYETYPLPVEEVGKLLMTIDEILKKLSLYIFQADYDFTLHTVRGVDRVIEFMRAYSTIIKEDSEKIRYRFDDYYTNKGN